MGRTRCRYTDSLTPVGHAVWLTVRDPFGKLLESRELAPGADLRAVLTEEYERRATDGWHCEEPPAQNFAGFFCRKEGLRVLVNIAPEDPAFEKSGHASYSWSVHR